MPLSQLGPVLVMRQQPLQRDQKLALFLNPPNKTHPLFHSRSAH
jgi:hypothetical protein